MKQGKMPYQLPQQKQCFSKNDIQCKQFSMPNSSLVIAQNFSTEASYHTYQETGIHITNKSYFSTSMQQLALKL